MRINTRVTLFGASLWFAAACQAGSPWLPAGGKGTAIFTYVDDSFQDYRQGAKPNRLPAPYGQQTYLIDFEYGLKNNLTLDFQSGHTETGFRGTGGGGIADTTIGMRWQVLHRESWVLTLRGAAIVAGNYPTTQLLNWSPGDKASGGLGSAALGVALPKRFFAFTEMGYRVRSSPVPQDFFGNAGIGKSWKSFTFTSDYQTSRSINGVDIVGGAPKFAPPYFTAALFPATKKIFGAMDYTAVYGLRSGVAFGFTYSTILHGRNVGLKRVLAASVSYTLPGYGPHFK